MRPLVSIPTYNEAENIEPLVREILALEIGAHIYVVDDNSPDGTGALADRLAAETGRVTVLHRPKKMGLGSAHIAGFLYGLASGADCVITMDADFSHAPSVLPQLVAGMSGADVMIGSRYIPGGNTENWSLWRRALSRTANIVARSMLRLPAADCTGGLRCYGRRVLEAIDPHLIQSDGYSFQEEMLFHCHRAGFRIGEIPITFIDRRFGQSKISRKEVHRAFTTILRLATRGR